ncbi:MAG: EAL domain-containing protein [Magnetococcales bacterium]|nr:EAL domain-containing protein [Magnetococcales bacterium]
MSVLLDADFHDLIDLLPDALLLVQGSAVIYGNPSALVLVGMASQQELVQCSLEQLFQSDGAQQLLELMNADTAAPLLETQLLHHDGEVIPVEVTLRQVVLHNQSLSLIIAHDVRYRRQIEEHIRRQASYDILTGLPNRALFLDRMQHEIIRAKRAKSRVALMFIDLDRFKWVNDTLGHAAGDQLLREAAARLLSCHRESDTVARLGGDEFTIILPDMARGPHAERVASQILKQLAQPFILEGQEAYISGSIGVTVFPDDADDLEGLLKNADCAMYHAKADGRNAYRFFTSDMHAEAQDRMELEKHLHKVLERRELVIHYQPIVDLRHHRRIVGAEALLRWAHPSRGLMSPDLFLPLAEEIGLLGHITEWTILTACRQTQQWRLDKQRNDLFISLNLSCTRCRELSTDNKLAELLQQSQLPPIALVFEITENIIAEDPAKAMAMLHQLRHLGVQLWLDDFGTGNSSLSVLKRLPVTGVKIDRSFTPDALTDQETGMLVRAIVSLASSLHRKVIGEGVETERQEHFLREQGCDMAQGYLYGRPMSADEFGELL